MISVVVLFRNATTLATDCLNSLVRSAPALDPAGGAEFVFVDDFSDPQRGLSRLLLDFRAKLAPAPVSIIRFKKQMHYAHGLAYSFSLARGESVLFVSHDMVLTKDCVEALLEVAASDPKIGIVRPRSPHMDWARKFVLQPRETSIEAFSADVRRRFGTGSEDWPMLIGDAMLVKRSVIDKIGVFDTRYFGFMSDIDYGIRAHRAGFRHVIALGAWLHHEGNGAAKETALTGGETVADQGRKMLEQVEAAYAQFRAKWGNDVFPGYFREMRREHFNRAHALSPMSADQPQPPLVLTPDVGELM